MGPLTPETGELSQDTRQQAQVARTETSSPEAGFWHLGWASQELFLLPRKRFKSLGSHGTFSLEISSRCRS